MRWIGPLLLMFYACASKPLPAPLIESVTISPPNVSPEPLRQAPESKGESLSRVDEAAMPPSELRAFISNWIYQNPEADFEEVARQANRAMQKFGYPYVVDASAIAPIGQTRLVIKAGGTNFLFTSGKELSDDLDVCGERYLRFSARPLGQTRAALIVDGREYPFNFDRLKRERFRIYRGKKLVATIYAPEPSEPIALVASGKALRLRFPLQEELTTIWWQKIGNKQPSLLDEEPYLSLRVEKERLYFDENIEHLAPQEFEVETAHGKAYRWKFFPSKLTLWLDTECLEKKI